ncbi:MAG: riboflavin synthase [Verrucomicrobiaceae bacterium]|nr:riboflavin synthase [Verrucomicrobiaceae bacterium]
MFTGLIETTGTVVALNRNGESARLTLKTPMLTAEAQMGESIAINGCCLTVAEIDAAAETLSFDLLAQTLKVTNLGDQAPGDIVNMERAMTMGARFGGHFVQGHVDTTARILDWSEKGQDHRLEVELPPEWRTQVLPKGSICLDGISLTAAEVTDKSVTCWIIPHTCEMTHLLTRKAGQRINVEFDMLGKYVRGLLENQGLVRGDAPVAETN